MKPNIDRVIEIFSAISQQLGPQYLAYWALPNTILTLSGARAYCDGVFWANDNKDPLQEWNEEIAESMEIVKKQIAIVWSDTGIEEVRSGEKYANYELIAKDGLRYGLTHTDLLSAVLFDEAEARASAPKIIDMLCTTLKSQPKFKEYTPDNLHDIAFGILLGYPDKAILDSILKWDNDDPFAEPMVDADIRGAAYYVCPQPVYSYPRHLMDDPTILAHEKLWSGLLKDYYQSNFHSLLEKNGDFQAKLRELGNLR